MESKGVGIKCNVPDAVEMGICGVDSKSNIVEAKDRNLCHHW